LEKGSRAMRKPFLILQLRPETEAADDEFAAILRKGGVHASQVRRVRLDQKALPADLDLDDLAGVIVGGGPGCVSDAPEDKSPLEAKIEAEVLSIMPEVTARDLPFLGCCYGIGILGKHLEADVSTARYGEPVGTSACAVTAEGRDDPLLEGVPARRRPARSRWCGMGGMSMPRSFTPRRTRRGLKPGSGYTGTRGISPRKRQMT
jgi:GMP synthase (glutamine-hydrolysing)